MSYWSGEVSAMPVKRGRTTTAALLSLFVVALAGYLANGRTLGAGDTLPAAYLPWSLLRHGTFDLREFRDLYEGAAARDFPRLDGMPYYLQPRNGHVLSAYGPWAGVLATPVYAPFVLSGVAPDPLWAARLEKLAASIMTALSAVVLCQALARVTTLGWALVIALVYAFGTSSLSVSSQGLWQHGPSQLFLAMTLYCLARGRDDERFLGVAGLPMAAAVALRATDLLLVLPAAAWIVVTRPRARARLVAWALVPTVAVLAYHAAYVGLSDHGLGGTSAPLWALFVQTPPAEGYLGVLVSPSRGLFVYSPVLALSLVGMVRAWRHGPAFARALALGPPLAVLVIGRWVTWWGGHSWGPRLLADLAPILCFLLYPLVPLLERRRLLKVLFVVLSLWSVGAHSLGAWLYDRRWDAVVTTDRYARLGHWDESPLAFYGREAVLRLNRWLPPSIRHPERASGEGGSLAATYAVGTPPADVTTGERFVLPVTATNVGTDVWRVGLPGERGGVVLVWRWFLGDREVAVGSEGLLADVRPGGTVTFGARIVAPPGAGAYTLVVDLVSHLVSWFADRGRPTVRLAVTVGPRDVAGLLSGPLERAPGPALTLTTSPSSLAVTSAYPPRQRNFDVYLVRVGPDGAARFFDGHAWPPTPDWGPWVHDLPLPARAAARFRLPVAGLAQGVYRWYVVATTPGGFRPLARASAEFRVPR
jgi:hypothetical protein